MEKHKLMTKWREKELVCCCPIKNQCSKNHGCEELEFNLDPYADVSECMQGRAYKRVNGAMRQTR
ncbi:MAG: hypothetical protein ACM3X7_06825 [Solirubrobacterales bacterium]